MIIMVLLIIVLSLVIIYSCCTINNIHICKKCGGKMKYNGTYPDGASEYICQKCGFTYECG